MNKGLKMFSLEGKKAVITGGAGVLCSTIGLGLGMAGAEIAICDIKDTIGIVNNLRNQGINAKGFHIDVTDFNSVSECKDNILKYFGKIDILINGAGGNMEEATTSKEVSFFDLPLKAIEEVIKLNLIGGTIMTCQIFGKEMSSNKNGGSIINISSINTYRPLTRIPGYAASKAAVSNFTQWLATYFAMEHNKNLRVNAIAAGFFLTEQLKYLLFDNNKLTPRGKSIISHTPIKSFGEPEDLIGICIWLSSEASKFVTGSVICIDGGFNSYAGV